MSPAPSTPDSVRVAACGRTDPGRRRDDNQDALLIADLEPVPGPGRVAPLPGGSGEQVTAAWPAWGAASVGPASSDGEQAFPLGSRGALFLVADGMGGAAGGATASAMAVTEIHRSLLDHWVADGRTSHHGFARHLRQAVERANTCIWERAASDPSCRGMGSTATLAGVLGDFVYVVQVGDSRAYLVRHGEAVQITRDQSYVQELVDAGRMTEEEAERSEHANVILQALGAAPGVQAVLTYQQLRRGDLLLVCSDGLTRVVRAHEIAEAAAPPADPAAICRDLVELANARGGPDNVTVVAARFDGAGLGAPGPADVVARAVYEPPASP